MECVDMDEGIKQKIEAIRDRMVKLGNIHGLDHQEVLRASRELDALIVHYYGIAKQS